MKYKDYEFTIDLIHSICRQRRNGERTFTSGYLCRVYSKDDYFHEKVLDEICLTYSDLSGYGEYGEVAKVIEYIENKYYSKDA